MIRNPQARLSAVVVLILVLASLLAWCIRPADASHDLPATIILQTDGVTARVVHRALDGLEWQLQSERVTVIQRDGGSTVSLEIDLVHRWEQVWLPVVTNE